MHSSAPSSAPSSAASPAASSAASSVLLFIFFFVCGTVPQFLKGLLKLLQRIALRAFCVGWGSTVARCRQHQNSHHLSADFQTERNQEVTDFPQAIDGTCICVNELEQDLHDVHPELGQLLLLLHVVPDTDLDLFFPDALDSRED